MSTWPHRPPPQPARLFSSCRDKDSSQAGHPHDDRRRDPPGVRSHHRGIRTARSRGTPEGGGRSLCKNGNTSRPADLSVNQGGFPTPPESPQNHRPTPRKCSGRASTHPSRALKSGAPPQPAVTRVPELEARIPRRTVTAAPRDLAGLCLLVRRSRDRPEEAVVLPLDLVNLADGGGICGSGSLTGSRSRSGRQSRPASPAWSLDPSAAGLSCATLRGWSQRLCSRGCIQDVRVRLWLAPSLSCLRLRPESSHDRR